MRPFRHFALPLLLVAAPLAFTACTSPTAEQAGAFALTTRTALDLLPADAEVVGLINVAEARASDALASLTDAGMGLDSMTGEGAARVDDFMARTGFDLEEDLERVYVAANPEAGSFVMLMYADVDRARMDAYLQEQTDVDTERTLYRETPIYVSSDAEGEAFSFALPNDEMMIGGSDATVRAVLDRMADGGAGLRSDATMMGLLDHAAHPDDAWFAVRSMDEFRSAGESSDAILGAGEFMQRLVVSAGFGADGLDVSFFGQTTDAVAPSDVADIVRGAISGMRMTAKDNPELTRALDRMRVSEARDAVRVDAFVSEALLAEMRDR
ncbi:MAG: hypothetical protein AAGF99_08895 [Bacteroidota bacterium]